MNDAMLFALITVFFLVKSFGEMEWRSHPYLTQTQIRNLPLPDLDTKKNKILIKQITKMLKVALSKGKPSKIIKNHEICVVPNFEKLYLRAP